MSLQLTAIYASILAIIYFGLTVLVVKERRAGKVSLGDGSIDTLNKAIRAHANFIEYVPICILLLLIAEINGSHDILLHIFGVALVLGRLSHWRGILANKPGLPRIAGMLLTFAALLGLAVLNLISFLL
jgi:uncharacterized membrane protein YecN with MAPEG domain